MTAPEHHDIFAQGLPDLSGLREIVDPFLDSIVYLIPMTFPDGRPLGNNGDHLMHNVFLRVLREFGIKLTADKEEASAVFVPPNGALLETYSFPTLLTERLEPFRSVPVVLFPSSALFPSVDPSFMFRGRTAPTIWITREKYSHAHLVDKWGQQLTSAGVDVVLDHDIVASGHTFVPAIIGHALTRTTTIVAAREDREARASSLAKQPGKYGRSSVRRMFGYVKNRIPRGELYGFAARTVRKKRILRSSTSLLDRATREIGPQSTTLSKGPISAGDLSAPQYFTFSRYRRSLASADTIITDRLHVALPGAILGKEVYLVEAGYHKLQGVYEQSLQNLPNVHLVTTR